MTSVGDEGYPAWQFPVQARPADLLWQNVPMFCHKSTGALHEQSAFQTLKSAPLLHSRSCLHATTRDYTRQRQVACTALTPLRALPWVPTARQGRAAVRAHGMSQAPQDSTAASPSPPPVNKGLRVPLTALEASAHVARVCVTGAGGYVASAVVQRLLASGHTGEAPGWQLPTSHALI
jgi:hypothetical protein